MKPRRATGRAGMAGPTAKPTAAAAVSPRWPAPTAVADGPKDGVAPLRHGRVAGRRAANGGLKALRTGDGPVRAARVAASSRPRATLALKTLARLVPAKAPPRRPAARPPAVPPARPSVACRLEGGGATAPGRGPGAVAGAMGAVPVAAPPTLRIAVGAGPTAVRKAVARPSDARVGRAAKTSVGPGAPSAIGRPRKPVPAGRLGARGAGPGRVTPWPSGPGPTSCAGRTVAGIIAHRPAGPTPARQARRAPCAEEVAVAPRKALTL